MPAGSACCLGAGGSQVARRSVPWRPANHACPRSAMEPFGVAAEVASLVAASGMVMPTAAAASSSAQRREAGLGWA